MATKIFVNLPVKNLSKSIEFFTKLGYIFNPNLTDDSATCMIVSPTIFVMLLVEERFKDFTKKAIANATKTTEVLLALDFETKEEVDSMVESAIAAGGKIYSEQQDHGWMYSHSYADLDGHQWQLLFMDPNGMPQA